MPFLKIKIPSRTWSLIPVHHPSGYRAIKKARTYASKALAMSAISNIHSTMESPGIKISKEIRKDMYFVIHYDRFWSLLHVMPYCYIIYKNPTDVEEVEVDSHLPHPIKYKITSTKLTHCLRHKDDKIMYGVPNHESEGEPIFILLVRFRPDVKGWESSKTTLTMMWLKINGAYHLAFGKSELGTVVVKTSAWVNIIDYIKSRDDEDHKQSYLHTLNTLSLPTDYIDISESDIKKVLQGINKGE